MSRPSTTLMRTEQGNPVTISYDRATCTQYDLYPGDVIRDTQSNCDMMVVGVGLTPLFAKDFIWLSPVQRELRKGVVGRHNRDQLDMQTVRRASAHLQPEVLLHDLLTDPQLLYGQKTMQAPELKHLSTPAPTLPEPGVTAQSPAPKTLDRCTVRVHLPAENGGNSITSDLSGGTTIADFSRKLIDRLYAQLGLAHPSEGAHFYLATSATGEPIRPDAAVRLFRDVYLVSNPKRGLSANDQQATSADTVSSGTGMRYWFCDHDKWNSENSFVFIVQDVIYWCPLGERTMSAECSIPLTNIREILRNSRCPHSQRANPDLCFTIITKQNTCVNFETQSPQDLELWVKYISVPQFAPPPSQMNEVLKKGASFVRFHMRNEQPLSTPVFVYCQNERLFWKQSDGQARESSIAFQDITSIQVGRSSGIFLSVFAQNFDPTRCLSVIASSVSLHLVASSRSQADEWLSGLRAVCSAAGAPVMEEKQDQIIKKSVIVPRGDLETLTTTKPTPTTESHTNDHVSKQIAAKAWRLLEMARHSSRAVLSFGCSPGSLTSYVLSSLRIAHTEVIHIDELQELVQNSMGILLSSVPMANPDIGLQLARSKLPRVLCLNHGPLTRDRLRFCAELAMCSPSAVVGSAEAISALWLSLSSTESPQDAKTNNNKNGKSRFALDERLVTPKTLRRPSSRPRYQRTVPSLQPVLVQVGRTESDLREYTFDFEIPLETHLMCICEICGIEKSQMKFQALFHLRHRCYVTEAVMGKSTCSVVNNDVLLLRDQVEEAKIVVANFRRHQQEYERDCELSKASQLRGETRAEWHARRAAEAKRKEETDRLMYVAMSEPSLLETLELDMFCEALIAKNGLQLFAEALKWVPSPETAGPHSTAKVLMECIGSLVCFESALDVLEDRGMDYLYGLIFDQSPFIVREAFSILKTVFELAPNAFVMVHTAAQRVARARLGVTYMHPIQLLSHPLLRVESLSFFNCLIEKTPSDLLRLSLLKTLDNAGLFQALPRDRALAQELLKFRELTVMFRPLGPVARAPQQTDEESPQVLRANQDGANLAAFLAKSSSVVVVVTHPSSSFVTDGRTGIYCLNGPTEPLPVGPGVDALIAAFLAVAGELSPLESVACACGVFGRCQNLAGKARGTISTSAAVLDALYSFNLEQAAHTLWFKRCSV